MPNIDKIRVNGIDYNVVAPEIYDDQERVIGTWFGKPLYRKLLEIDNTDFSGSSIKSRTYSISSLSVNNIINTNIFLIRTDTTETMRNPYIAINGSTSWNFVCSQSATDLYISIGTDLYNKMSKIYAILEYTKTTDTVE